MVMDDEARAFLIECGATPKELAKLEALPESPGFFTGALERLPVRTKIVLFRERYLHGRDFRAAALEAFEEGKREGIAQARGEAVVVAKNKTTTKGVQA